MLGVELHAVVHLQEATKRKKQPKQPKIEVRNVADKAKYESGEMKAGDGDASNVNVQFSSKSAADEARERKAAEPAREQQAAPAPKAVEDEEDGDIQGDL